MPADILQEVAGALREAVAARSRFYASMGEPDKQQLGPPAPEQEIVKVEKVLGGKLPPSYRAFLCLHDGWRMVDAASDLYSCAELVAAARDNKTKRWRAMAKDGGDASADAYIVIGGSKFAAAKFLLDPLKTSADGEMAVVEYDKAIEEVYESFLSFLQQSSQTFVQASSEIEGGGFDFSNV